MTELMDEFIYVEQHPGHVSQGIYKNTNRVLLLPVCTLKCFLPQLGTFGILSLEVFLTAVEIIKIKDKNKQGKKTILH